MAVSKYMSVSVACYTDDSREKTEVAKGAKGVSWWAIISGFCYLISNRDGLGASVQIMGLATNDPHSHKVQTKLYKIPNFCVNLPNIVSKI